MVRECLRVLCWSVGADHDMQSAQHGHSPQNNPVEEAELRYQIRRLSAHPSIAMCQRLMLCRSDRARRLANLLFCVRSLLQGMDAMSARSF